MVSDFNSIASCVATLLVLILVLMEYGLWRDDPQYLRDDWFCSLNPCSNGIWSLTKRPQAPQAEPWVLILVLMEYGLWHSRACLRLQGSYVLILVLMEYGLWLSTQSAGERRRGGVLILVLMEYGLWQRVRGRQDRAYVVLILVLMEYGLWPTNVALARGAVTS